MQYEIILSLIAIEQYQTIIVQVATMWCVLVADENDDKHHIQLQQIDQNDEIDEMQICDELEIDEMVDGVLQQHQIFLVQIEAIERIDKFVDDDDDDDNLDV